MINKKTLHIVKGSLALKALFFSIISFLFSISLNSQQNDLALKAELLVYSNPDEAIKIAEHILNLSSEPQKVSIANLILVKSYLVKGAYNNAIIHAFDEKNQLDEINIKTRIENNILKATVLRKLYLDNQSTEYLDKARTLVSEISSEKDLFNYLILLEHANMLLDRLNTNEALTAIKDTEIQFKQFLKTNVDEKRAYYLAKERAFNSLSKYDSAFVYINKTLDLLDSTDNINLYEKAIIYKELGHLYLQKKEFKKSKELLFISIRYAEILGNPFLLEQINKDIATNYLASNQNNEHKVYYEEFLKLNKKNEEIEEESVNTFYKTISNQNENLLQSVYEKYNKYQYISLGAGLFIMIIGIFVLIKSENKKKRKREIINYLDVSRNNFIKVKPSIKKKSKRLVISEETEEAILAKLKKFESTTKFLNKDMSLAVLAGQFETNTKYLSEIINKNYNDNFNTFINKLRINYIIEKLKTDPNYINYKISFLAEKCGFSSHSSFTAVFKSIVGMSPATFINLINIERDEILKKNES